MVKLFFITFFTAELIIAISLILKIVSINKCVNSWNTLILSHRGNIKESFSNLHMTMSEFSQGVLHVKTLIEEKRKEYTLNLIQTLLSYLAIFSLRGKYKKAILTYQLLKELYEGLSEA